MRDTKKGTKIKLASWIAALAISQVCFDKLVFDIPTPMLVKDIELYQPRSALESSLRQMNLYIHDKNLIADLSIQTGKKTINEEYIKTLKEYHSQILQLYKIVSSKAIWMAIEKMGDDIITSINYTKSNQCLLIDGTKNTYDKLVSDLPLLIEKLKQRPGAIIQIQKRINNASPSHDELGQISVDAVVEKLNIVTDLMEDPFLAVRKENTEALKEINNFLYLFDDLYEIHSSCAVSYNEAIKNSIFIKEIVNYLLFILLTILIYRKELIN